MACAFIEANTGGQKRSGWVSVEEVEVDFEGIQEERRMMDLSLLEELKDAGVPTRPDGFGITVREFAENAKHPCAVSVARTLLNKMVSDGTLAKTMMNGGAGGHEYVYHRVGECV